MIRNITLILISALTLSACSLQTTPTASGSSPINKTETQESTLKSVQELLNLGTSQKCTWSETENGEDVSGTIYIKDKNFKQVSRIKRQDGEMEVSLISDGVYFHSWNDKTPSTGIKMKIPSVDSPQGVDNTGSPDLDRKYNFNCTRESLSDSDFELPKNIQFMDLSQGIQDVKNFDKIKNPVLPQD